MMDEDMAMAIIHAIDSLEIPDNRDILLEIKELLEEIRDLLKEKET